MIKINGQEIIEVDEVDEVDDVGDPCLRISRGEDSLGNLRLLVAASCDAFFARHHMPVYSGDFRQQIAGEARSHQQRKAAR